VQQRKHIFIPKRRKEKASICLDQRGDKKGKQEGDVDKHGKRGMDFYSSSLQRCSRNVKILNTHLQVVAIGLLTTTQAIIVAYHDFQNGVQPFDWQPQSTNTAPAL
jgi:hypothetical protein